jgi:hypothetical protein
VSGQQEQSLPSDYMQTIHGELHFRGDVGHTFDPLEPKGPSTLEEWYWFVSAEYDKETDTTTAYFSANPPEAIQKMYAQQRTPA